MISVRGLCLGFRDFALRDVNLTIETSEYFMLVGPTGAGKTLLLETIAGLHSPDSGEIWSDDINITGLEPEKRGVGIVYQDSALFPHLSVAGNITFGLRVRKVNKSSIEKSLQEMAATVGVTHLLNRMPGNLSGGERQKVALARALIVKPRVLLLDEPLSALDPESRENLREELRALHKTLGITTVHVTHDFDEAISLGNRLAVLGDGEIRQVGTPQQVFRAPNSEFVARFTLTGNIYAGEISNRQGKTVFIVSGMEFTVAASHANGAAHAAIRPENVLITSNAPQSGDHNCFAGVIKGIVDRGATVSVTVCLPLEITGLLTRHAFETMSLSIGQQVYVTIKSEAIQLFDK